MHGMNINEITYTLPPERIAKHPPKTRGDAKLLVLHKDTGEIEHKQYKDLPEYLNNGDLIIRNNTKVIPARLLTKNPRGGTVELLLIESHQLSLNPTFTFECLYGGSTQQGDLLQLENIKLKVEGISDHGTVLINSPLQSSDLMEKYGHTPIPPYLKREDDPDDKERYQTPFAEIPGSVAAPTASLNFTDEIQALCRSKGADIRDMTLHVGRGTFLPIKTEKIEDHIMHKEFYSISPETVQGISTVKQKGRKVFALGTTVTRALEHMARVTPTKALESTTEPIQAEADLFIFPGYDFKIVDALLTNFHAPHSTVLLLAAAFAGKENLLSAYNEALKQDYKFLSYGDSMLII